MIRLRTADRLLMVGAGVLLSTCAWTTLALAQNAAASFPSSTYNTKPAAAGPTTGVTPQMLLDADKDGANWLMYNRTYDNHRFSPLTEINAENVKNLKLAYSLSLAPPTGTMNNFKFAGLEGTPIVRDGHMFVTDGWDRIYKLDLTSGKRATVEWIYDPEMVPNPAGVEPPNNKGVALLGDNVYSLVYDGRLVSLNAETGELNWEKKVQDSPMEVFTMAPLAIGNTLMIGTSNGDVGARFWAKAVDATTGDMLWQFYTIPAPGEAGHDTWKNDAWQTGGGATWNTPAYDPASGLTYWGVGNPFPDFDPAARPGDNLYANSVVALKADTGELDWYFQYTPNEAWDYDEIGGHVLVDTKIDGEDRKVVAHFGRNGFFYNLDRTNGSFINGSAYVDKVTWTKGIDPKTGKPAEYDAALDVQTYIPATRPGGDGPKEDACPNLQGGTNYFPPSYSPMTGKLYAVAMEGCFKFDGNNFTVGEAYTGSIVSVDPLTGGLAKKANTPFVQYGGVVSTAGGVIFSGEFDGTFEARDATTLDVLWSVNLGASISAPPITYSVNGKQYVAIEVGASPISTFLPYLSLGEDPAAAANMQPSATVYFFAL